MLTAKVRDGERYYPERPRLIPGPYVIVSKGHAGHVEIRIHRNVADRDPSTLVDDGDIKIRASSEDARRLAIALLTAAEQMGRGSLQFGTGEQNLVIHSPEEP